MKAPCSVLLLALVAAAADAKPSQADLKAAGKYYDRAEKAYQLGDYEEARKWFEKAYAASEDPVVLLNVAQAIRMRFEQTGDDTLLGRARDLYRSYLREVPDSPNRAKVEDLLKKVEEILAGKERPGSGTDAVAAAKRLAEQREYDQALAALDAALQGPNNTRAELVDIYKLRGIMLARRGREDEAQQAFKYLLAVDPGHRVAETSEAAVIRAFAAARAYWSGKQPPALDVRIPARANPEEAFVVGATVRSDPLSMISDINVLVRIQGQREYVRVKGNEVPGTWATAPGVELVVLGVDSHGGEVCAEGHLDSPLRVSVGNGASGQTVSTAPGEPFVTDRQPESAKPWYKRPLVWGTAGAVVVGAIVAAIVVSGGDKTDVCATADPGCPPPIR